jgi:hypothetical protein
LKQLEDEKQQAIEEENYVRAGEIKAELESLKSVK